MKDDAALRADRGLLDLVYLLVGIEQVVPLRAAEAALAGEFLGLGHSDAFHPILLSDSADSMRIGRPTALTWVKVDGGQGPAGVKDE
jgi:hypothetical protein